MKKIILSLLTLISFACYAQEGEIKKFNWNGLEVVYLPSGGLPNYTLSIYFADGSLSDNSSRYGETEIMFEQISSGTKRYDQRQIAEYLEFYGSDISTQVLPEFSSLKVTGLAKDIIPTTKMMCHLLRDSTFPKSELNNYKKRAKNMLQNLASNHAAVADRAFRQLSLKGTIVEHPSDGYLNSISRIRVANLKDKLNYMNDKVRKKVYITGPESVLGIQSVLEKDCKWGTQDQSFVRAKSIDISGQKAAQAKIYFIPVKDANQAQIRIGRFINGSFNQRVKDYELAMASGYLGSGFTSVLMQEIRVKRGLTYGIGSFAGMQKTYGRSGISTSTRNEKVEEMLTVIRQITKDLSNVKNIDETRFEHSKNYLKGNYLFGFEKQADYLSQIIFYDHMGIPHNSLKSFPDNIDSVTKETVSSLVNEIFNFDEQVIIVVGHQSVAKSLSKIGKVTTLRVKDIL